MTDGPRLRETLNGIPLYKAGQRPQPRDDLETFKISSNENPYPPLPRVLDVIAEAARESNRYPDPSARELVEAISEYHDVSSDHVAVGTGAVALCYQVAHCTVDAGDEIIFPWRSFEAYPIVARVAGARAVPVPVDATGGHDLDAMASAVTDRTRLIFVCSPNNPTGTVVTQQALDEFLARIPRDVLVVLDEAYVEFNRDAAAFDGIATYSGHDNVAVLRTFSKAYGLAGLRVGYAIAPERIIGALQQTALPFGVSHIAQQAAIASLADGVQLLERVDALVAERNRVLAGLRVGGWPVWDSQANFIWLGTAERTEEFCVTCDAAGLTVRAFPGEGVRVTVAEPAANTRFIDVANTFLSER
ncbi:MAG: histidinol-phosphate transaminase [Actinomycetes bacterium]